jgi:DNA-binding CsgD family transcriptional regulator
MNSRNYYNEYLDACSLFSVNSSMQDLQVILKAELSQSAFNLDFGTCLIDNPNRRYLYMSDNCQQILSYPKEEYLEGGLDFYTKTIFYPEDRVVFEEQVFRDIKEHLHNIAPGEVSKYRFSFNHRYLRKDGTVSQMFQQVIFLELKAGFPILNFSMFSDISDFKTDNSLVLAIYHYESNNGYAKVFSKSYTLQGKSILSVRESEILRLSFQGLSSRMVADKLFISQQTVKNHKRNMMEKTSAKNIAELIHLSLQNNWL